MDETKLLTPEERHEFRELDEMFRTRGWRRLKETLQDEIDKGPAYWFANAQSWEEILAARARIRAVVELVNYETITETRKENLTTGRRYEALDNTDDVSLENF